MYEIMVIISAVTTGLVIGGVIAILIFVSYMLCKEELKIGLVFIGCILLVGLFVFSTVYIDKYKPEENKVEMVEGK